jgi:hypothetical protein
VTRLIIRQFNFPHIQTLSPPLEDQAGFDTPVIYIIAAVLFHFSAVTQTAIQFTFYISDPSGRSLFSFFIALADFVCQTGIYYNFPPFLFS